MRYSTAAGSLVVGFHDWAGSSSFGPIIRWPRMRLPHMPGRPAKFPVRLDWHAFMKTSLLQMTAARAGWLGCHPESGWSGQGRVGHHSRLPSRLRLSMIPPQGKPACGVSFQLSGSGRKDLPAFLDPGSLWCFGYRLASQSRSDTPSPFGPAAVELDIPARRRRGLVLLRPPTLLLAGFRLFSCSWTSVRMSGAAHRT